MQPRTKPGQDEATYRKVKEQLRTRLRTAKTPKEWARAFTALRLHKAAWAARNVRTDLTDKNEEMRLRGHTQRTKDGAIKRDAAGQIEWDNAGAEGKVTWQPYAVAEYDLGAIAKEKGISFRHSDLDDAMQPGKSILPFGVNTTAWGFKKLKNDGYTRASVKKYVDSLIQDDIGELLQALVHVDNDPKYTFDEAQEIFTDRIDSMKAIVNKALGAYLSDAMGKRIDAKIKLKDFQVSTGANIMLSTTVIAGATAASVVTLGGVAPAAAVTISQELVSICNDSLKLWVETEGAGRVVRFQIAGLYKAAGEKAAKSGAKRTMRKAMLGMLDATMSTLTDYVKADELPSIENAETWIKVHGHKITELQNFYSKTVNRMEALDAFLKDLEQSGSADRATMRSGMQKFSTLGGRLDVIFDDIKRAEADQENFEADLTNLKSQTPDLAKAASLVLGKGGSLGLAAMSGKVNGGEAFEAAEIVYELVKELGVDAAREGVAKASDAGGKAKDKKKK